MKATDENRDDRIAYLLGAGLPDGTRAKVAEAYRRRGGTFAAPSLATARLAVRDVRRSLGDRHPLVADELTRREDAIELALIDARRRRPAVDVTAHAEVSP